MRGPPVGRHATRASGVSAKAQTSGYRIHKTLAADPLPSSRLAGCAPLQLQASLLVPQGTTPSSCPSVDSCTRPQGPCRESQERTLGSSGQFDPSRLCGCSLTSTVCDGDQECCPC